MTGRPGWVIGGTVVRSTSPSRASARWLRFVTRSSNPRASISASSGTPWRASPALRVERSESNAIGAGAIASHAIIVVSPSRASGPQAGVLR